MERPLKQYRLKSSFRRFEQCSFIISKILFKNFFLKHLLLKQNFTNDGLNIIRNVWKHNHVALLLSSKSTNRTHQSKIRNERPTIYP